MKIILMRHGNAQKGSPDSSRPLSKKGISEAEAAGNFLRFINEIPDVILHSPLLRSRETAEHVEKALEQKNSELLRLNYGLKPEDSPEEFFADIMAEFDEYVGSDYKIMAVGHEPFISSLASLLLWHSRCDVPFGTGTLLEAESFAAEGMWNLCFYVKSGYLIRF